MNERLIDEKAAGSKFLDCALAIAQSIDNLEGRSELISLIATKYAESGQLDVAIDLVETIEDSYLRDLARAGVAAQCIKAGAADYAVRLSEMIEDDTAYALATEQMAVAYAESGAFEKSIEAANRLAESGPTLSRIALACVAGGQTVEALAAARSIDYADLKAPVLIELAARDFDSGSNPEGPEGLELLREATRVADEIEFPDQQISALAAIASLFKKRGQEEQGLEILSGAHRLCNESDDSAMDAVRPQIAGAFAELGRYDQAGEVMEEIEDPFQYADAAIKVGLEHQTTGDTSNALALFAQAMEIARDEEVFGEQTLLMRENLLDELAVRYATTGHYEEAMQITATMSSPDQQNRTLSEIAKLCVRSGNNSRVFELTELLKDNYARVLCDLEIVDAFIASEQQALADHTLAQALERAPAIERAYQKALALIEIASRFQHREQTIKASEILFDALSTLVAIDDSHQQSLALIKLDGKFRELGLEADERQEALLEAMIVKVEP